MRQEYLRAAAEAFAGVSEIESACYHYTEHGHSDAYHQALANYYRQTLAYPSRILFNITEDPTRAIDFPPSIPDVDSNYHQAVILTALTELTYPVLDGKSYAWTGRQRAAFAGIPRSTWADNNLSGHVNFIIDDIRAKSRYTLHLVEDNIRGRSAFA